MTSHATMGDLIDRPGQAMPSVLATMQAKLGNATRQVVGFVLFVLALGLSWQAVVWLFGLPPYIMPAPSEVFDAFVEARGEIAVAVFLTLRNAALGLAVALAVALILAATFTSSKTVTKAVLPLVIGLRTAPVLAIAPILILIFGRGVATAVVVVVIVSFFPIMVNAMKGFSATRRNTLELMHVLGATRRQTFVKVRFPYALSYIFTGLRSAATSAILASMLAEWLSGADGLGKLILDAASYKKSALPWAAVVASMAVAFFVFSLTTVVEKRLLSWRA